MALTDLATVKAFLGIAADVTDHDAQLGQLISGADQAIKRWCRRDLEQATYTEYYSGLGERDLVLRQWPVTSVSDVRLDQAGFFGTRAGSFPESSALTLGTHYVLVFDEGSTSNRGLLRRVGGISSGFGGFWPIEYYRGSLAARRMPVWPQGDGNIKVTYTAGYATVPADLTLAANELVAWLRMTSKRGGMPLQSESLADYSYTLAALQGRPELGSVRQLLAPYRELVIGY
jgi:hypothetical protein